MKYYNMESKTKNCSYQNITAVNLWKSTSSQRIVSTLSLHSNFTKSYNRPPPQKKNRLDKTCRKCYIGFRELTCCIFRWSLRQIYITATWRIMFMKHLKIRIKKEIQELLLFYKVFVLVEMFSVFLFSHFLLGCNTIILFNFNITTNFIPYFSSLR